MFLPCTGLAYLTSKGFFSVTIIKVITLRTEEEEGCWVKNEERVDLRVCLMVGTEKDLYGWYGW